MKKTPGHTPEELISQYTPLVYHIVSTYLTNPEDVKECVNEVFFAFYQNLDRFDPKKGMNLPGQSIDCPESEQTAYVSYLAAIAKNKAISYYRKNRRREAMTASDMEPDEICGNNAETDMEEELAARLDLEEALAKLDPEELTLIRKKYYHGMTIQEIAASMNLPYETVKKRHQRSIGKLRLLLLVVLLAALLAGCAYLVARHLGIIPGYGVNTKKDTVFYRMKEPVSVEMPEAGLTANITSAVYQDGTLLFRFQLYGADGEPYISALTQYREGTMSHEVSDGNYTACLNLGSQTLEPYFANYIMAYRVDGYSSHYVYQPSFCDAVLLELFDGADDVTVSLVCEFFIRDQGYSDEQDEYGFPVEWDTQEEIYATFEAELTLERMGEEELARYAYAYTEENGGIAAIPRLENGELIVELYPIQGKYGYVLPYITEYPTYNGVAGDPEPGGPITATAEDGTILTGTRLGEAASDAVFFSEWNFGPAEPGTYTLHIPYLLKYYYDERLFEIPIDIVDCTVEDETYRFEEGTFRIVNIEPTSWDEVEAGNYPEKFIPEWYYNEDYGAEDENFLNPFSDADLVWRIDFETTLDAPGEYLTNMFNMNATRDLTNTMVPDKNFTMLITLDYPAHGNISCLLFWVGGSIYRETEPYDAMYLFMRGMAYDELLGVGGGAVARWDCDLSLEAEVE